VGRSRITRSEARNPRQRILQGQAASHNEAGFTPPAYELPFVSTCSQEG